MRDTLPYFVFSGKFVTTPSSPNSYMENYKKAANLTYAQFKKWLKTKEAGEGSNWMTYGDASWKFVDCKIQQVTYKNGYPSIEDTLVGVDVNPATAKIHGRIVDLDPERTSSELWGFVIRVGNSSSTYIEGNFAPAPYLDTWKRDISWQENTTESTEIISLSQIPEPRPVSNNCSRLIFTDPKKADLASEELFALGIGKHEPESVFIKKEIHTSKRDMENTQESYYFDLTADEMKILHTAKESEKSRSLKNPPKAQKERILNEEKTYIAWSSTYRSVLESVQFGDNSIDSEFLREFIESTESNLLSIKFTVDNYDYKNATGRVVGMVTPYLPGQPISLAVSRQLIPSSAECGPAYFQIAKIPKAKTSKSKNKRPCYQLLLDLSNSIPMHRENGNIQTDKRLGDLIIGVMVKDNQKEIFATLKLSEYKTEDWYLKNGGIKLIRLNAKRSKMLIKNSLKIWHQVKEKVSKENGIEEEIIKEEVILEEKGDLFVKAENTIYRLNPNDTQEIRFAVTRYGDPVDNEYLDIQAEDITPVSIVKDESGKIIEWQPVNKPTIQPSHIKVENGFAIAHITAPSEIGGTPRKEYFLDSLVYQIKFKQSQYPIYALVFDKHEPVQTPTWKEHVEPILKHYACLYPLMAELFGLHSYEKVTQNLKAMERSLSAPIESAHYMPVKRDLSLARREILLRWLKHPLYSSPLPSNFFPIETLTDLKKALHSALELEHATIPVYMSALYSIKPGTNEEVANMIRNILMQEMLHVALVCNLLNAIGEAPRFTDIELIPSFPGRLPYNVHPELEVTLGACTKERIESVFMFIEQPGEFLEQPNIESMQNGQVKLTWLAKSNRAGNTIGQFYGIIQDAFVKFFKETPHLFSGERSRQVSSTHMPGLLEVVDLSTAIEALEIIVRQGEGASFSNMRQSFDSQESHYHKFLEIYHGSRLLKIIEQKEGTFLFQFSECDTIVLDKSQISDPWKNAQDGSGNLTLEESVLLENFNQQYAKLLISLEKTFNGEKASLEDAIALMRHIQIDGMKLLHPEWREIGSSDRPIALDFKVAKYLPQTITTKQIKLGGVEKVSKAMAWSALSITDTETSRLSMTGRTRKPGQLLSEFKNVSFFKPTEERGKVEAKPGEPEKVVSSIPSAGPG